ncbi:MAG: hypothetical protein V3W34_05475 [Phycisphaerae bacterium]
MTDDPLIDVLNAAVKVLDAEGVPYAVTGSVASSILGEPLSSIDVDLVVRMTSKQARRVAGALPRRFYCTEEMLVEAAANAGMVNLIDQETRFKVDISVLAHTPFFDKVMTRRAPMKFGPDGPSFYVVSAEDIILMKLLWRKDSRSQKQWENALGVVRVRGAALDWKYMFQQAAQLGISEDLEKLRDEGGI